MNDSAAEFRKLPLRRVIWGAFSLSWLHRTSLFRATALPMLAVIALKLVSNLPVPDDSSVARWMFLIVYAIAICWLAVAVHRLVLLETSDANSPDARNLRRIALFFAVFLGVYVLFTGVTLLVVSALLQIFVAGYVPAGGERPELPVPFDWLNAAAQVLAYYVIARFSLVFPAIATDRKLDVAAAWRASKRNGWRLAVVIGVLPWSLAQLTDLLYRDGATTAEFGVLVVLTVVFTVIEVVALSLSYGEITSPAPPPTDPPA